MRARRVSAHRSTSVERPIANLARARTEFADSDARTDLLAILCMLHIFPNAAMTYADDEK
jgi:hypothetical protein